MAALQPFSVICPSCEDHIQVTPKVRSVEVRDNDVVVTLGATVVAHRCVGAGAFPHPRAES